MYLTKEKKCCICGASLRTSNNNPNCSSHDFPPDWDPKGDEIREQDRVLRRTGVMPTKKLELEVAVPVFKTFKLKKVNYKGIKYEFLTSSILEKSET